MSRAIIIFIIIIIHSVEMIEGPETQEHCLAVVFTVGNIVYKEGKITNRLIVTTIIYNYPSPKFIDKSSTRASSSSYASRLLVFGILYIYIITLMTYRIWGFPKTIRKLQNFPHFDTLKLIWRHHYVHISVESFEKVPHIFVSENVVAHKSVSKVMWLTMNLS